VNRAAVEFKFGLHPAGALIVFSPIAIAARPPSSAQPQGVDWNVTRSAEANP